MGCGGLSCVWSLPCCWLEVRCTSSLLQGHPPSLRFGHPDVATDGTGASARTRLTTTQHTKTRQPSPPRTQNTQPPSNTLNRDSPPPPQFARHGAHTEPPQTFHHPNTEPPRNTLNRDSPPPPQFARHGAHTKPPRTYRNPGGTEAYPEYRYTQRCIYPLPRHQGVRALRGRVPCRSKEDNMHLKPEEPQNSGNAKIPPIPKNQRDFL